MSLRRGNPLANWLGEHQKLFLLAVPMVTGGIWLFTELADIAMAQETHAFDERVLLALRVDGDPSDPIGPEWVEEIARDITSLAGTGLLVLVTTATIAFLLLYHKYRTALLVGVAIGGGQLVNSLLKLGFDRPRPELVPHETYVYSASFPSGHSMMAAVVYLTLAALLARTQPHLRTRAFFLVLGVLITLLVGSSRIYLGVHWPTDVLAGWTAGAVWAFVCWSVADALQRGGHIEDEQTQ